MKNLTMLGKVGLAVVVALVIIVPMVSYETTSVTDTITIDNKFSSMTGNGPQKSVRSGDTRYQVNDDVLILHNTSDELFESMEHGHTYQVNTVGWDVPALGMYPNIVSVVELD